MTKRKMKFMVDTALYRRFEVEANSEEEAGDIIAVSDLDSLKIFAEDLVIRDIIQVEE